MYKNQPEEYAAGEAFNEEDATIGEPIAENKFAVAQPLI